MSSYDYIITSDGELYHHGVKGMKWGVRRYRNKDGSLTPEGEKRELKKFIDKNLEISARTWTNVELAKQRLSATEKRLSKARNEAQRKELAAEKRDLEDYIHDGTQYKDLQIDIAKHVVKTNLGKFDGKPIAKLPIKVTKTGERYIKDNSDKWMYMFGAIGASAYSIKKSREFAKDFEVDRRLKRQGLRADYAKTRKDYGLD